MSKIVNPASFGRIDPKDWRNYPDHYTDSLWPADLPSSPSNYGNNDFHGRTHPEIIKVAAERYTKPGDIVWDPMAGSGTTIDVAKEMGLGVVATDLHPVRDDIQMKDVRYWRPEAESIDLVIFHPPYMDIVDLGVNGGFTTSDLNEWREACDLAISNIWGALKPYHVLVAILGGLYGNVSPDYKENICLDLEIFPLVASDFRLLGRVVRPYGETKGTSKTNAKNENLWKYRRFAGGYWSLGIDTVLFLQKVN